MLRVETNEQTLTLCLIALVSLASGGPASAARRDQVAPRIEHQPLRAAARDKNLEVRAEVYDDTAVMEVSLNFRNVNEKDYTRTAMSDTGLDYVAVIPADMVWDDLEYFIEAYDTSGNGPARVGTPTEPLRVRVLTIVPQQPAPAPGLAEAEPRPETPSSPAEEPQRVHGDTTTVRTAAEGDPGLSLQQWLGVGAIGLGALGLASAALFVTDYVFFVRPPLEEARANRADSTVVCPGSDFDDRSCFADQIKTLESAETGNFVGMGVGLTVAVLSGAAAYLLLTIEPDEDVLGEADAALD
jgi:hypothetical protein